MLSPRQLLMVSHSLTTDLLPLLSASIFTSEKILFDVSFRFAKELPHVSNGPKQMTQVFVVYDFFGTGSCAF